MELAMRPPNFFDERRSIALWPREATVKAWLREHWATWQDPATRPHWYDDNWRGYFDPAWLTEVEEKNSEGGGGR